MWCIYAGYHTYWFTEKPGMGAGWAELVQHPTANRHCGKERAGQIAGKRPSQVMDYAWLDQSNYKNTYHLWMFAGMVVVLRVCPEGLQMPLVNMRIGLGQQTGMALLQHR